MNTPRRNARRGRDWELALLTYMRGQLFNCERLRLAGRNDEGDLVVFHKGRYVVIEAKAPQPGVKTQLGPWKREAEREARNYARARSLTDTRVIPVVAIKHNRAATSEAHVVIPLHRFLDLLARQEESPK